MKLPYLKFWDNVPVTVSISDGITENGAPNLVASYTGKCNFDEKTKRTRTPDGMLVELAGVITIGKDIAPSLDIIDGEVTIGTKTWSIYSAARPRNPDGTINHTRLELK